MSLQYLTNANPPPAQSVLQYDVEPGNVFISSATESAYANLTITVYNPTDQPVNCMEFRFGFMVDDDRDALTSSGDIANITPVSDQDAWGFNSANFDSTNPNLYLYVFAPAGIDESLPLGAQQSLVFHLNQIKVVMGDGIAPFTIFEITGTSKRNQQVISGAIPIDKTAGSLSINAFDVSPPEPIIPGVPIVLSWEITGADRWQLYDLEAAVLLYDSTNSSEPNLMSWPVSPQQLTPQVDTFYLLIASAGELFNMRVAGAMVMAAHFLVDPTANPPTINPGGTSMLSWKTHWATQLTITAEGFKDVQFNAPPGQFDIFPGAPGNSYQVSPSFSEPFTLKVSGLGNSEDTKQIIVSVNLPPPTITSFAISPSPPVVFTGQSVNVSWQAQEGYYSSVGQQIRGTNEIVNLQYGPPSNNVTVTPTGISDFILTIYGDGLATQQFTAIENQATLGVGNNPDALLFDGTNIWVANYGDGTVNKIVADNGTVLGTYPAGLNPAGLAYDGTYIWIANELAGNAWGTTLTKLKMSDASPAGVAQVGNGPVSLAFDGKYIYVANNEDNTVMKLNPQDGSVVHTYSVGTSPQALLFDGSNLWVANWQDNTVSKLQLSDDTVLGPYGVGSGPTAFAFDGANIWVGNQHDGSITKLRASDGAVLATYPLGEALSSLAFDGENIWAGGSNGSQSWLVVLRAADGSQLVNPIPVASNPTALVFDGNYMWVALEGDFVLKL